MNKNKIIELKGISKEFNGETVLSEISLDIHEHEDPVRDGDPAWPIGLRQDHDSPYYRGL